MPKKVTSQNSNGVAETTKKIALKGRAALEARKNLQEQEKESLKIPMFKLIDGQTAFIQIIEDGQVIETHQSDDRLNLVPLKNAKTKDYNPVCQHYAQKSCILCEKGYKISERMLFKVLDWRGALVIPESAKTKHGVDWTKTYYDKVPKVSYWKMPFGYANQLYDFLSPYLDEGADISSLVISVTRTGNDTSTKYNFTLAVNTKTRQAYTPKSFEDDGHTLESIVKLMVMSDEFLIESYGLNGNKSGYSKFKKTPKSFDTNPQDDEEYEEDVEDTDQEYTDANSQEYDDLPF